MVSSDGNGSAGQSGEGSEDGGEPIPVMQRLMDNPFLLLFLGIAIPAVLYLMWGIMEVVQIPIAK